MLRPSRPPRSHLRSAEWASVNYNRASAQANGHMPQLGHRIVLKDQANAVMVTRICGAFATASRIYSFILSSSPARCGTLC